MNMSEHDKLADYYEASESWAENRDRANERSLRIAWIVAAAALLIALIEGIALLIMLPLKQVAPIAVMVDRQTGNVERLDLGKQQSITPDQSLVNSMLAQYVIAREGFNFGALKADYNKVALWTSGEARNRYISTMQASNPTSPLALYPRAAVIAVEIRSISRLGPDTGLVRFATSRSDGGGAPVSQGIWAAVVKYRFSNAGMSEESRLVNPLGFQVVRYDRNAEIPPASAPEVPVQQALPNPMGQAAIGGTGTAMPAPVPTTSGQRVP
ncbi:MAG: VirB8/TrbF family protein [Novosphingobium sp.]|uniref:virB8 family protein n=1 Tax=Novosphingobium sp. TaxID=1874826 RepID=UPI0032BD2255